MIEPLLARLQAAGLELTDEEVADSIWLAMQMASDTLPSHTQRPEQEPPRSPSANEPRQDAPLGEEPPGALTDDQTITSEADTVPEPKVDAVLPIEPFTEDEGGVDEQEEKGASDDGLPFRSPATTALQNALAVGRALRPFMRKVPSQTRLVLDEEATVSQIADRDVWLPVLKPDRERWLDLELVVEESRSSFIWRDAVDEFQQLLKCQGAFRNVRVWRLHPADNGDLQLVPFDQARKAYLRPRGHRELLHASKRGLILLVSDCTSNLWIQSRLHRWLQDWSQHEPTALIQLVPERLWGSSELGLGSRVQLKALAPGVANPKLVLDSLVAWERECIDWTKTLLLPVVTLEARPLEQWARLVSGAGNAQVPGVLFDLEFVEQQTKVVQDAASPVEVKPEELVDRFLTTASPIAQQLAGMMAAAPVSLPVVHLIQKKLLPGSTPVHVAEVFLSGMVKRTSADSEPEQYDFVGDARKLLNIAMRWDKTRSVLDAVSEYIAEKLGKSIKSFDALLLDLEEWEESDQAQALPFAQVTLEVLRNLGGEFAIFADEVEASYELKRRQKISNSSTKLDFPGIPTLEDFEYVTPVIRFEDDREDVLENEIGLISELVTVEVATITIDPNIAEEDTPDPRSPDTLEPFEIQIETIEKLEGEWFTLTDVGTAHRYIEPLEEGVDLEMVAIPAGEFLMGSLEDEPERYGDESPQHSVTISSFFMGRYPVTQAQWRVVAGFLKVERDLEPDPSRFKGDNRPVERVSWYDAVEFCHRLSRHTGREYRLPSEAEWEYACRAGTTTPFHFGKMITTEVANYNGSAYADGPEGENREETTPVNEFGIANAFGLSDMHGNVFEWCLDHWHKNYEGAPPDGTAWLSEDDNAGRVYRGGSWIDDPWNCRSAYRNHSLPDGRSYDLGFRVVVAPRGTP